MEPKEKKAFEPTGLVPRSIVRTFERFRQQLLPGSETAAIREYRISRYQVLVSARCLFILLTIPIATNWLVSNWLLSPIIEHFWNTQQNEIFLNSYQEERAFSELEFFSEKLFFESLLTNIDLATAVPEGKQAQRDFVAQKPSGLDCFSATQALRGTSPLGLLSLDVNEYASKISSEVLDNTRESDFYTHPIDYTQREIAGPSYASLPVNASLLNDNSILTILSHRTPFDERKIDLPKDKGSSEGGRILSTSFPLRVFNGKAIDMIDSRHFSCDESALVFTDQLPGFPAVPKSWFPLGLAQLRSRQALQSQGSQLRNPLYLSDSVNNSYGLVPIVSLASSMKVNNALSIFNFFPLKETSPTVSEAEKPGMKGFQLPKPYGFAQFENRTAYNVLLLNMARPDCEIPLFSTFPQFLTPGGSFANPKGAKDILSQQLTENAHIDSLKIKERVQEKILELAVYYNQQTILSITNVVGDLVSLFTLGCLFIWMRPEITILKSFLIEAIYSLSDTTKSFLLILLTDLLVGFHSPRGWETALELLLKHFGLPENQDFVFLFVATFPVLLDTVFKYWIFRHLNKISPSTVATYHSMIE